MDQFEFSNSNNENFTPKPLNIRENSSNYGPDGSSNFRLNESQSCSPKNSFNYPAINDLDSGKSRILQLPGACREGFQRVLNHGAPCDEAKILAQHSAFKGFPNTQFSLEFFRNPKHNSEGVFDDFRDFIQFSMENAGYIPQSTQHSRGGSFSSIIPGNKSRPKRNRKKRKNKNNISNLSTLPSESKASGLVILTPAERKRAKRARRKIRLRDAKLLKNAQLGKTEEGKPNGTEKCFSISSAEEVLPKNCDTTHVEEISPENYSDTSASEKDSTKTVGKKPCPNVLKAENEHEVSLGILPIDYPLTLFTSEQLHVIQKEILAKVALQKTETVKPRFKGVRTENGIMIVHCADAESALWLKSIESSLGIQSENKLKIVDKIPKSVTVGGYFPESKEDSTEFILELISGQNDDLRVDEWRVVDRKEEENNSILIISLDETLAHLIKTRKSINYKFGFATFFFD